MGKKIDLIHFGLITSALKRVQNQEWNYNHHFFFCFYLNFYQQSENIIAQNT